MPEKNRSGLSTKGYSTQTLMGDIRKSNNFVVIIDGLEGATESVSIATTQGFIPESEVSVLTLPHGNDEKKFAGKATWKSGTLVFNDVVEPEVLNALQGWYTQVYNPATGAIGNARDYKKMVTVIEFTGDIDNRREWSFVAWPSTLTFSELDSANSNLKTFSMTLELDPPESHNPIYSGFN